MLLLMGCGAKKTKYVEEVKITETENVTLSKETEEKITETKTEKITENETRSANESRITNESFTATELTRTFADGSTETYKNPSWNSNNSATNNNQTTRDYSEEITADLTSTINYKIDSLGQLIRKEDVRIEDESEKDNKLWLHLFWLVPLLVFVFICISNPTKVWEFILKLWK
nr:hypothetical protein [uncultured Flavobacterium sp.]